MPNESSDVFESEKKLPHSSSHLALDQERKVSGAPLPPPSPPEQPSPRQQKRAAPTANDDGGCITGKKPIEIIAEVLCKMFCFLFFPIMVFFMIKIVKEYERAVVFRMGRLLKGRPRGPGTIIIIPCIDEYVKVDLRTVSFDVPPQEVLTKDSVTVSVDAVVYYKIVDPILAVTQIFDYSGSTRLLAAATLRNVLGTKDLAELLSEREAISLSMQHTLEMATDYWGIDVERVEIKDVRLPFALQKAMAAEAEAAREARAKIIAAEGEIKASKALQKASTVMADNPMALQLRYLQTLNTVSADKNSTIIFPFPMDWFSAFRR